MKEDYNLPGDTFCRFLMHNIDSCTTHKKSLSRGNPIRVSLDRILVNPRQLELLSILINKLPTELVPSEINFPPTVLLRHLNQSSPSTRGEQLGPVLSHISRREHNLNENVQGQEACYDCESQHRARREPHHETTCLNS